MLLLVHLFVRIKVKTYPIQQVLGMSMLIYNPYHQLQRLRAFSIRYIFKSYLETFFIKNSASQTLPLWAKIVIIATVCTVAATAAIVPAVILSQKGQSFDV